MRIKSVFGAAVAATASVALAVPALADAKRYATDFSDVTITKNDPTQWRMSGSYDAEIVTEDGNDMLRISNAKTSGSFGDMLYSPALAEGALETGTTKMFKASFDIMPVELQPGLRVTVSPDNGQGGRAGFPAIEHREDGLALVTAGSYFDDEGALAWNYVDVATGLDPAKKHTVQMKLQKKADTKRDSNNDVFSVKVNKGFVKNTTFEAYYDVTGEAEYEADTLLFRVSGAPVAELAGKGLLIDNLAMSVN